MLISELLALLDGYAPLSLAMDWDNVGLMAGDASREVKKVLVSLDVTPNAVQKAIETGADLILSHHPFIFRPINRIIDPLTLKILEHRIAVISLHTNLDVAEGGVNHALAAALGLKVVEHLTNEQGGKWHHLSVTAPLGYADRISEAVYAAGGGRVGNYASCSSRHTISGTFRPLEGARPHHNAPDGSGKTTASEEELEYMVSESSLKGVVAAIKASHPYEMPLMYWFPVEEPNPIYGLGLVGRFEAAVSLTEALELTSEKLRCPSPKLWTAGKDTSAKVERIAVCGGAGGSILKSAECRADLVITGDIGYHALLDARIPVIDAGHFYTEYPVLEVLAQKLFAWGLPCEVLPREEHEFRLNLVE
jgi:dinuclear metal center YbgI/SA1388 family protein